MGISTVRAAARVAARHVHLCAVVAVTLSIR